MKKYNINLVFCLLLFFVSSLSFAQLQESELENNLKPAELTHPYLLFDEAGMQDILQSVRDQPEMKDIYDKLLMEAYRFLMMPVDERMPVDYDLSRFFAAKDLGNFSGHHCEAAVNLAFAYQMTGEKKYAHKAFLHAEMLCRLESWVYPFHQFQQIYDRVWPWGVDDDQVVFSYDLQSARIATHMALVYDWIYPAMEKAQRDRLRGAMLEKAITRVRGNFELHWWASAPRCNWSGICYSGAGLASLALLTEDPYLLDVVVPSYNGVHLMLDELGPDGGWQEGRGYWSYGLGHSAWFMDAVSFMTGGTYNLFQHERLRDNPADFPLYTLPANFGDGRARPVGSSYFINKLASETGNQTAAWYSQEFIRNRATLYDLIWPVSTVEAVEPEVKSKHFRGIDWAILRSTFKSSASFTLACKAGLNDDPHHGHLDCGHFKLDYKGASVIRDLGSAKYDDYYFSAERWDYIEASSEGHNLVYVNGEQQISAKYKDQPWTEGVGGSIEDFQTSESMDRLRMTGLHKAYPGVEMQGWEREIVLYKPSLLIVSDRVESHKGAEIRSRLLPGGTYQVHDGYFTIEAEQEQIAVVPFSDAGLLIEPGKTGTITVNENSDFHWIHHVDAVVQARAKSTRTGYVIFPLAKEADAKEVLQSLSLKSENEASSLSFTHAGEDYHIQLK